MTKEEAFLVWFKTLNSTQHLQLMKDAFYAGYEEGYATGLDGGSSEGKSVDLSGFGASHWERDEL